MENLKLANGVEMPLEGFGVFQVPNPQECKNAVLEAIKAGYRLIDTAAVYMNEDAVGAAIKEAIDTGIVKREPGSMVTLVKPLQNSNAAKSNSSTEPGITNSFKPVHPENAPSNISFTPSGITIDVKRVESENANS